LFTFFRKWKEVKKKASTLTFSVRAQALRPERAKKLAQLNRLPAKLPPGPVALIDLGGVNFSISIWMNTIW
jgi:hypothetical protein